MYILYMQCTNIHVRAHIYMYMNSMKGKFVHVKLHINIIVNELKHSNLHSCWLHACTYYLYSTFNMFLNMNALTIIILVHVICVD